MDPQEGSLESCGHLIQGLDKICLLNLHFLSCKMGVHSPPCREVMNRNKNVEYLFRPWPITVTTIVKLHHWPSQEQWHESIRGTTDISSLSFHNPQCISDACTPYRGCELCCMFVHLFIQLPFTKLHDVTARLTFLKVFLSWGPLQVTAVSKSCTVLD